MTAHIPKTTTKQEIVFHCGKVMEVPPHARSRLYTGDDLIHRNPQASDCEPCRDAVLCLLPDNHPSVKLQSLQPA